MHTQKIEKPCYIKSMGTFNTMPRPFKRCRDKEFFKKLVESNAYEYEYRQIRSDLGFTQGYGSLKILYFYDSAYAILEQRTANELEYCFYRIGCLHNKMKETNISTCYNELNCLECGYSVKVDSSD